MNLEIINKWLENEFGVSYTRLEELHDFVVEQDLKHQDEKDKQINQLQSNWNSLREWLERMKQKFIDIDNLDYVIYGIVLDKMNELEGVNNGK